MRTNKIHIYIIFLLVSVFGTISIVSRGNNNPVPAFSYIIEPMVRWDGDSLRLSYSCSVKGNLKASSSFHIVPLYIAGKDTLYYPVESFYTPSEAKYLRRRLPYMNNAPKTNIHVINSRGRNIDIIYSHSMKPVLHTKEAHFQILHVVEDCCNRFILSGRGVGVPSAISTDADTLLTNFVCSHEAVLETPLEQRELPLPDDSGIDPSMYLSLLEDNVSFVTPAIERVKAHSDSATIRIDYPVNKWRVLPEFENNAKELHKVDDLLSEVIKTSKVYKLTSMSIKAYASPEATYAYNLKLSGLRAEGMQQYLRTRYNLPGSMVIKTEGKGEDWTGLRAEVAESNMKDKDTVLYIIDFCDIFAGREGKLRNLSGGDTYRYMLRNFFPSLRRMEMKINYTVSGLSIREADSLMDSRPRDLSLYEMYEVARSRNNAVKLETQRGEYGREYDIAVSLHRNDTIANINASSAALLRGDMKTARECLERVKASLLSWNNLGVYYLLCGRRKEAEELFIKAERAGVKEARLNREKLNNFHRTN